MLPEGYKTKKGQESLLWLLSPVFPVFQFLFWFVVIANNILAFVSLLVEHWKEMLLYVDHFTSKIGIFSYIYCFGLLFLLAPAPAFRPPLANGTAFFKYWCFHYVIIIVPSFESIYLYCREAWEIFLYTWVGAMLGIVYLSKKRRRSIWWQEYCLYLVEMILFFIF